jgi:hypothetical protein
LQNRVALIIFTCVFFSETLDESLSGDSPRPRRCLMDDQPEQPQRPADPLPADSESKPDDSQYNIAQQPAAPRAMPDYLKRHLDAADRKLAEEKTGGAGKETVPSAAGGSGQPLLQFLTRPNTIAAWIAISLCLLFAGCLSFLRSFEGMSGYFTLLAVYVMFVPVMLGIGYVCTCMLRIIENVLRGIDEIEPFANLNVIEWAMNLAYLAAIMIPAIVLGFIVGMLTPLSYDLAYFVSVSVLLPVLLLGSLFADGAWAPLALPSVWQSMTDVQRDWIVFYAEILPMLVSWIVIRAISWYALSWLGVFLSYPLLALVILIYTFLLGRLARSIATGQAEAASDDQEDDQEDEP